MTTHRTLEAAARAHGARNGVTGKPGGWLYRNGVALCQGWRTYGENLVNAHAIYVLDEAGCRVDREKTATGIVERGWAACRPYAVSFVVPEPEHPRLALGLGLLDTPEAVAVDTTGGYVFRNAEDGQAFTLEGAKAFAAKRNEGLKVPTYKVFRLTEVEV